MTDISKTAFECRRLTAEAPEVLQRPLYTPDRFARFLSDRFDGVFWPHTVFRLWRSGLLRADWVQADIELDIHGLDKIIAEKQNVYVDNRLVPQIRTGWGSSLQKSPRGIRERARSLRRQVAYRISQLHSRLQCLRPSPKLNPTFESIGAIAHFHPFRILPLYTLFVRVKANPALHQFLLYDAGLIQVAKVYVKTLRRLTATPNFRKQIEYANSVAELCIALEPLSHSEIYGSIHWTPPDDQDSLHKKVSQRRKAAEIILDEIGLEGIKAIRERLCQDAEIVEKNKRLHRLVRFTNESHQLGLKGPLGIATIFIAMAETLRRAAESHFGTLLPEEDEIGFGQWMPGARQLLYGSERPSDLNKIESVTFLRHLGLDHGVAVRCYVEGNTEEAAVRYAFESNPQISVINLRAQVVERGGRGLAFRESLMRDMKEKVFSVVMLDSDREDNIRLLKKAVRLEELVGAFFISNPDVEYENFSTEELLDVAIELSGLALSPSEKSTLIKKVGTPTSAKEFFGRLRSYNADFQSVGKGRQWGEALLAHAAENPRIDPQAEERQLVRAIRMIGRMPSVSYAHHVKEFIVDEETGQPMRK